MSEVISSYSPSSVAGVPTNGEVYVFVGMFQGLISEVEVYRAAADVDAAFLRFCGVSYDDFETERAELSFKFEGSTIYVVPVR
jgi:hypothetical protein